MIEQAIENRRLELRWQSNHLFGRPGHPSSHFGKSNHCEAMTESSGVAGADPSKVDGNDLAPIQSSESLAANAIADNHTSNEVNPKSSSVLPSITAALVDDETSLDIAFISMQQLLNDPATGVGTSVGAPSTSAALEPSIVSGTTDLFEGDLCDDELPSIMNSNGENLQLNAVELVEEVQQEVQQQQAADDPEVPTSMNATATAKPAEEVPGKPPVVPFAVVRKLSDAQIVGEKVSASSADAGSPKRAAVAPPASSATAKKARTSSSPAAAVAAAKAETPAHTGRMTRSRAKRAGAIADECVSSALKKPQANKKAKSAPKLSLRSKKATTAPLVVAPPKAAIAPTTTAVATSKVAAPTSKAQKPTAPTPPPTVSEPVITDSASDTGSITKVDSATALPVVTPVCSDETVTAKQLEMASKIQSATNVPNLPSLTKKSTTTAATTTTTKAASTAAATTSKRPTRRSSTSKANVTAAAAANTPVQPAVAIDTSTAHIQALTGENGASVCLSVRTCTFLQNQAKNNNATTNKPPNTTSSNSQAPMTEEERAQQSRDRNRKHARNTRLRKKAYVEELKQTLNELVSQRDRSLAEQQQNRQREMEQREVRFRVIEEFLKLRGRNEKDSSRWSAILQSGFSMSLPLTTFQTMVSTTKSLRGQTLNGVEEVMEDSSAFATFLQTLGKSSTGTPILITHECDRTDFMMDGCNAVLGFKATSVGAVSKGASAEMNFHGTIRAHFCAESNRLRSLAMIFDTGTIVDQRSSMLA